MFHNFFTFLLFVTFTKNYVISFNIEGIVGGYYPEENTFKYQMVLNINMGPTGPIHTVLCTGAIVHKQFVVTIATCFTQKTVIHRSGLFLMRWYDIAVGAHDFYSGDALVIDIEVVYVPERYDPYTQEADLAAIKLKKEIDFNKFPQIESLELPDDNKKDEDVIAVASGYGYITFEDNVGFTDYELKYVRVNVTTIDECNGLTHLNNSNLLCARSIPDNPGDQWGICKGDAGAPLVFGTKLIGLANRARHNCVDIGIPTQYTRIKIYTEFIRNVLEGSPPPGTRSFTYPFAGEVAFITSVSLLSYCFHY